METVLIRADSIACQVDAFPPITVSSSMESSASGGLPHGTVAARGDVCCSTTTTMFIEPIPNHLSILTWDGLLVASRIKT